MRLATLTYQGVETVGVLFAPGWVPLSEINANAPDKWPTDLATLIESGSIESLNHWYRSKSQQFAARLAKTVISPEEVVFSPLLRNPSKIWGIGLNYANHAADLSEKTPTGIPASFMKPATTIVGHQDTIHIPTKSKKTTAEGELGIIIGKQGANVAPTNWLEMVAGFTTIIDMTAEDILRQNPRYLTISKSFDTFFSCGPTLVTPDEIADIDALMVATISNGRMHAQNVVANMTFSPQFLVSFLSEVMTLQPGDIISTGTPGAVAIKNGDIVECRITGFHPLINPVVDLKTRQLQRG